MINLDMKFRIFDMWYEKKSVRDISKTLGIHRNTVTKCIEEFKKNTELLKEVHNTEILDILSLKKEIVEPSRYIVKDRKKTKLTEDLLKIIDYMYKQNDYKYIMDAYKEIEENSWSVQIISNGNFELLHTDPVGYSTFCKAVKIVKERAL